MNKTLKKQILYALRAWFEALTPWHALAFLTWLGALFIIPPFFEFMQWIPEDAAFVPILLILFLLPTVLFHRQSYQIGQLIVVLSAAGSLFSPLPMRQMIDGLNNRMQDAFFQARGPRKPSGQVVIVDIDQRSMQEIGQWPWPRTELAQLVENLKADGARVIGFDIVFPEPDRHSLDQWLQRMQDLGLADVHTEEPLTLSASQIRSIVLSEWARRLGNTDPTFELDLTLSQEEQEATIQLEYLAERRGAWEEEQNTLALRYAHAGRAFSRLPFPMPKDLLVDMALHSRELFFLKNSPNRETLYGPATGVVLDNDRALAKAMHDGRVVGGGLFVTEQNAGSRLHAFQKWEARRETRSMVISAGMMNTEQVFPGLRTALEQVLNVSDIQDGLAHQGFFNVVPDASGAARAYTMLMQAPVFQESLVLKEGLEDLRGAALLDPDNYDRKIISQNFTYPSLALEMFRVAHGFDQLIPGYEGEERGLFLKRLRGFPQLSYDQQAYPFLIEGERFIPIDFKGDMPIDYQGYGGPWRPEAAFGPEYYFDYHSAADVIRSSFAPGTFNDKYVLIGSTDPTLSDLVGSPFRPAFPGLEVHAVVLDNLVQERYLTDSGKWATLYHFIGILVIGSLIAAAVAFLESWQAGLITLCVLTGLPAWSYWGLVYGEVVINFVYPWLTSLLMTGTVLVMNFFVEGRDRRFVTTQFSSMVSGDVLKKLKDDPAGVSLAGQKARVSVLFSDIAGFTSMSEQMSPKELVRFLNDYFTPMTEIILEHEGFIDKFMGDGIMSCWGVPFPDAKHAEKACLALLDQQVKIDELAPSLFQRYGIEISVRMGLSSGEVNAALMGSESRKSYTVMGDVVNLGARLEPCCKDYGVRALIDQSTYQLAKGAVEARCVDKIVVKGKTKPVPIYEVLAKKGELSGSQQHLRQDYEAALQLYWERQWDAAELQLTSLLTRYPEDGPSKTLLSRVQAFRVSPPPESWQGEFVRTQKA